MHGDKLVVAVLVVLGLITMRYEMSSFYDANNTLHDSAFSHTEEAMELIIDEPAAILNINSTERLEEYRKFLAGELTDAKFEPAPRTSIDRYNILQPETRYFLYSPSGGMGNQLIELTYACVIARKLNRTVLVPMLGSHTSLWTAYERLPETERFPMDRILDFPHLTRFCPALPLDISVVDFAARNAGALFELFQPKTATGHWTVTAMDRFVRDNREAKQSQVFYFRGGGMYHHEWMPQAMYNEAKKYVRFSPYLRLRALELVNRAFPMEFNAIHIRLGDYAKRWSTNATKRAHAIARRVNTFPFQLPQLPLYVATDEPKSESLDLLKATTRSVLTIANLSTELRMDFAEMFPQVIRLDMLGVLDQLVCAQAKDFIPTSWSTFSTGIREIRQNKFVLFPESD